ncbi:glutathione S-transferase family protein [Thalassobaculum salexigens]|uniref:glutathione S-transferase family protein n=1 Tax=Thalassobaculum salexigens TaxID=455360 RepID=UPI0004219C05|nr:glutathione S-transferase N-terminal domain-containing protein [Thalassobaculum salexigens]
MKLYERLGANSLCPSPIGYRVRIALALKGMDCARVPMRFADVDRLEVETGARTCPAMVDGASRLTNSEAIVRYLDAVQSGRPVYRDEDRYFDLAAIERELGARAGRVIAPWFIERLCPEDRDYYRRSREERYGMTFAELVAHRSASELDLAFSVGRVAAKLERSPFFSGREPGFADAVVYGYLLWIELADPSAMPELPADMAAWYEARDLAWRRACLKPFAKDA